MSATVARWLIGIGAGLFPLIAFAQPVPRPLPPLLRTLSDEVGMLSIDESQKLSRSLEEVLDKTGVRMVMVIAESTAPEPVEDYTERLAQRWKRERSIDLARSVFIVIAVKDREMQISPGRELESVERALARRGQIADLRPLFRSGRYFEALMILTSRIRQIIEENPPHASAALGAALLFGASTIQAVHGEACACHPAARGDPTGVTGLLGIERNGLCSKRRCSGSAVKRGL